VGLHLQRDPGGGVSTAPVAGTAAAAAAEVDALRSELSEFHTRIWSFSEPAWREYRSVAAYVDLLRAEGFTVESGSAGMPTAFHATWGDAGPAIGMYAEYDASPGYSQQAVPRRAPRDGLHKWAPGFTDAHSALGVGALGGALAAKRVLEHSGGPGRIHLFGEPAEKVCGSKAVHAAKGYYDGLDAAISYHPLFENTALGDIQNCMYWSAVFTFECTDAEPWVTTAQRDEVGHGAHNSVRSPGAVDALGLMMTAAKYAQDNMFPRTGLWSLNSVILGAGNATADNLPARIGQIQYSWRSPLLEIQDQVLEVLQRCARHAAGLANCEVRMRWVTQTRPGLANSVLSDLVHENLLAFGPAEFPAEATQFGRALERELGADPSPDPFLDGIRTVRSPQDHDTEARRSLPPWQDCTGADDYTEYTWHAPTVRFFTAKPLLRITGGDMNHWANNAMNGLPAAIDPCWAYASKVIAATALRLIDDPALLAAAHQEFGVRKETANDRFLRPLLPSGFAPPIDLPWPEYVQTARGYEWQLPTTVNFGEPL
jgi:aminobenzoyl-glutamate utilization protein B